jgi:hypothetical protein
MKTWRRAGRLARDDRPIVAPVPIEQCRRPTEQLIVFARRTGRSLVRLLGICPRPTDVRAGRILKTGSRNGFGGFAGARLQAELP